MAAAEARAAWQRTANRYFVQEDAKRAPKLACCPPSTFSSKQTNSGPTSATDSPDHRAVGFMPSKLAPSYSNLPYDAQWWLQMEPHYAIHRGLNFDQSKSLPMTSSSDSLVRETATMSEESTRNVDYGDLESFFEVKKSHELGPEELGVGHDKIDQDFLDLKNMTDYCESLDLEMVGGSVSKQTCEFSSGAGCLSGGEKMPWWRVTDEAELASIVAQKSLHHIGNCDLPPPQKRHVRREQPYKQGSSVDHDEIFLSSLDWGAQSNAISSPSSGGSVRKHWSSLREGPSHNENAAAEPLRFVHLVHPPLPSLPGTESETTRERERERERERRRNGSDGEAEDVRRPRANRRCFLPYRRHWAFPSSSSEAYVGFYAII